MERLSKLQKWILEKLNDWEYMEGIEIAELTEKALEEGVVNHPGDIYLEIRRLTAENLVAYGKSQKDVRITTEGIEKLKFISWIKDIVYREPLAVVAIIISIVSLISGLIKIK